MKPTDGESSKASDVDLSAEEVSKVLGKEHAQTILLAAERPVGPSDLSDQYDIPVATCYRRLEELEECGLLEEVDPDSLDGRTESKYRRVVDEISISYKGEEVTLTLEHAESVSRRLDSIWRRFGL